MAEIRHVLGANADELLRVLREVNDELRDTSDATDDADDGAKAFRKTTALLGGALAATTAVVIKGTAEAIALGDAYGKMSERTGQSVERLSELKLAAENSDTSLGTLSRGITTLSRGMLDFVQRGTGPVGEALQQLGIAVTDANGNLRDADAVLDDVADALAGMENGTEKAALAAELFGGGVGRELIPLLNQGSEGIDRLAQKSRALGVVWSDEASQAAEDFGDSLNVLNTAGKGVFQTAAQFWLPTLRDIASAFENATLKALGFQGSTEALSEIETLNRQLAEAEDARRKATDQRQQAQIRAASAFTAAAREQAAAEVERLRAEEARFEKRIDGIERVIAGHSEERAELDRIAAARVEAAEAAEQENEATAESAELSRANARAMQAEAEAAELVAAAEARLREEQEANRAALVEAERKVAAEIERIRERAARQADRRREEQLEAERLAAQERVAVEREVTGLVFNLGEQLASGLVGALQDLNQARSKDARKRKEREIGLAILLGELQAGLTFGSTLAQLGATPAGFAAAAAGAAAVGVATKISAAAGADRSEGYFHDGGVVGGGADEVPVMARRGEGFLTPQAVRNLGGADGVERVNRGEPPAAPGPVYVVQKVGHRVYDVQTHAAVRRTGSPLDSALRRTNPRGTARRNPYLTGAS